MKKDKRKTNLLRIVVIMAMAFLVAITGAGIASAFAAFVVNYESDPFVYKHTWSWKENEGTEEEVTHNEVLFLDCYPITGGYTPSVSGHVGVAVAWHKPVKDETKDEIAEYTNPSEFRIPETFTVSPKNYDVVAIAKGGFHYQEFTSISLPDSIQEIGEEAFYCCQNMTTFSIPYKVTTIAPSTFMDCRNLEIVTYRDASGNDTGSNDRITSFGDHAFTSCPKLRSFNCPSALTEIGDSAFQGCKALTTFYFPKTTASTVESVPANKRISVGNYAFAECDLLTIVYFDLNLYSMGEHVFVQCDKQRLNLNYTGVKADFEEMATIHPNWRDRYTAIGNTEQFIFNDGRGKYDHDHTGNKDKYPGLVFTIDNNIDDLMLDQSTLQTSVPSQAKIFRTMYGAQYTDKGDGNKKKKGIVDQNEVIKDFKDANNNVVKKYATIIQWAAPSASDFNGISGTPYYDASTGSLTIPDEVTDENGNVYPVRVIDSEVFTNCLELTSVTFGPYLVQIRHHAFLGASNIASLNFSRCRDLLEVSYEVFQNDSSAANTALTNLTLPDCLKYIGAEAFYNFVNVSTFHLSESTVFIGQYGFKNLGLNVTAETGTVDLMLPNTLRDGPVDQNDPAKGFKIFRYTANTYWDECIQLGAFEGANCLKTVVMEALDSTLLDYIADYPGTANEAPRDHAALKPYRMGIQIYAFKNCKSLVRFEANKLMYVIGENAFNGCTALKEMFLTTFATRTMSVGNNYPWGFNGSNVNGEQSIFGTDMDTTNLVIYIDDPDGAPKNNGATVNNHKWNSSSATYPNDFASSTVSLVATYNGVTRDMVKYYNLASSAATTPYLNTTDFSTPTVAFIKKTGDYTITRGYCGSSGDITSQIDMSKFEDASSIKTIGTGAFGQMDGNLPGRSFVLPSDLTSIEDRAFYRQSAENTNTKGVQIVTYRKEDTNLDSIAGKTSYCVLPSKVTSIGRLAFYNNCFEAVKINGDVSYLGNSAFSVYPFYNSDSKSWFSRSDIESIELGSTENTFSVSATNGGLYYTKEAARKTLIYQPAGVSGAMGIDNDTIAIGSRACANVEYSSVTIPDNVTTIYGGAFNRARSLATVNFGSNPGLECLGPYPLAGDTMVWSGANCDAASTMNDTPGSTDITFEDTRGAFFKSSIVTFDFTKLTSLRKIGYSSFEECKELSSMTGGTQKYTYYTWNKKNSSLSNYSSTSTNLTTGVLDLTGCTSLRYIGFLAFKNCTSIKFVHLPNTYVSGDPSTYLYLGSTEPLTNGTKVKTNYDNDEGVFSGVNGTYLVGENTLTANSTSNNANRERYPKKSFSGGTTLYQFQSTADLDYRVNAGYWYQIGDKDGSKRFVLFKSGNNSRSDAEHFLTYFASHPDL